MSWKTDQYTTVKNRGKETEVTLKLQSDTGLFRVRRCQRIIGAQKVCNFDTIVPEDEATPLYRGLALAAIEETFDLKENASDTIDLLNAEEDWPIYGEQSG